MEPNYLQIEKDNRIIYFRVDIEKKYAFSEFYVDYYDYHIQVSDQYVDGCVNNSELFLAVDDYRNIRIYDNFMKEYVDFNIDDLNILHYTYETLSFSGITLEYLVKEILYRKFVGERVRFDV